jgi:hypothetical protein
MSGPLTKIRKAAPYMYYHVMKHYDVMAALLLCVCAIFGPLNWTCFEINPELRLPPRKQYRGPVRNDSLRMPLAQVNPKTRRR